MTFFLVNNKAGDLFFGDQQKHNSPMCDLHCGRLRTESENDKDLVRLHNQIDEYFVGLFGMDFFPHGRLICGTGYQFVLRAINLYYGRATCTTDEQSLLCATSIVGTPVLRAKTINIWYDRIIKLMNILSGRPEWIFLAHG